MRRLATLLFGSILCAGAQPRSTVADVIGLVRDAVHSNQEDGQLAKSLRKIHLAERLDDHAIEELESEGAGPKALAELMALRDASQALPAPWPPPPFPYTPPPSVADQARVLAAARQIALDYNRSLPDFICTEVVRRFAETRGKWELRDTLELRLSYFEQKEDYKLLSINGHQAVRTYGDVGGTISEGEFGSLLRQVFELRASADFHWDHWTNLRQRPAHVFRFRVDDKHSLFHVEYGNSSGYHHDVVVGQHGFVYVDRDTNQILRIVATSDPIPTGFPVQESTTLLDYEFTEIGGVRFLLPLRADVRLLASDAHTKNEVEFHSYQKFVADSSVIYRRQ
jgi:hypothetical protein